MSLIVLASIGYGILAWTTGSILPGVVLHAAGDIVGFALLWYASHPAPQAAGAGAQGHDSPIFWINGAQTLALGLLTLWAFRRLSGALRSDRPPNHAMQTDAPPKDLSSKKPHVSGGPS